MGFLDTKEQEITQSPKVSFLDRKEKSLPKNDFLDRISKEIGVNTHYENLQKYNELSKSNILTPDEEKWQEAIKNKSEGLESINKLEGLQTPMIDPIQDFTFGAATGFKLGAKAGLKGAKLAKNIISEGISNVTWGASDLAKKGLTKGVESSTELLEKPLRDLGDVGDVSYDLTKAVEKPKDLSGVSLNEFRIRKEKIAQRIESQNPEATRDQLKYMMQKAWKDELVAPSKEIKKINSKEAVKEFNNFVEDHIVTRDIDGIKFDPVPSVPTGEKVGNINLDKMNISEDAKAFAKEAWTGNKTVLSQKEIVERAQEVEAFHKVISDDVMKDFNARVLKAEQNLTALLEKGNKENKLTREILDSLEVVESIVSFKGRSLNYEKIAKDPILDSAMGRITSKLSKLKIDKDEILKRAEGINWNNSKEVIDFYRSFVKPTVGEIIKEFRYINLLSSLKTHIKNLATNLSQGLIVQPSVKLLSGKFKEIPSYYRGFFGSAGGGFKQAINALKGETLILKPDFDYIPTNSKITRPFQLIPRMLEASDLFTQTMVTGGEYSALLKRGISKDKALKQASEKAQELLFRNKLDPKNVSGQGRFFSALDRATGWVSQGVNRYQFLNFMQPFIRTPSNILKRGLEMTPVGIATLPGNTHKVEQMAKMFTGSLVLGFAGSKGMNDELTGALPKNRTLRQIWEARGIEPWSVKIGEKWYKFNDLGPLGYPFAFAAAIKDAFIDAPTSEVDSLQMKSVKAIAGMGRFFADQSYLKNFGDLINATEDEAGAARVISNMTQQLIPLNSFRNWMGNLTNEIKHKSKAEFSIDFIIDDIAKNDPFFAKFTIPKTDFLMQPKADKNRIINAFSPVQMSEGNLDMERYYKGNLLMKQKAKEPMKKIEKEAEKEMIKSAIKNSGLD